MKGNNRKWGAAWVASSFFVLSSAQAAITVGAPLSATDLAQAIAGSGVSVFNTTYAGAPLSASTFSGGMAPLGIDTGVVLTTGSASNVIGPNDSSSKSTNNGAPGDSTLTTLAGISTFDAAVLEFDFVPTQDTITFSYVFGSEEYNEFVNSGFNDVFAFYVNGVNCAIVPGSFDAVSIDNVNLGKNSGFYVNNESGALNTQLDGLTKVLTCTAPVNKNTSNHMKLAIADAGDGIYDSAVFIRMDSLMSGSVQNVTPQVSLGVSGNKTLKTAVPEGPAGTYEFDALACNVTAGTAISGIYYQVTNLTNGNSLISRDRPGSPSPGGVGAQQDVAVPGDGILIASPRECATEHFVVGLNNTSRFTFNVNLMGMAASTP